MSKAKVKMILKDYNKSYGTIAHTWIIKCIKMMKIAD